MQRRRRFERLRRAERRSGLGAGRRPSGSPEPNLADHVLIVRSPKIRLEPTAFSSPYSDNRMLATVGLETHTHRCGQASWSPATLLKRIVPNAELFGIGPALLYGVDRVCERLRLPVRIFRYAIVAQPVPGRALLPPRRGRKITVTTINPLDPALKALELTNDVLAFRNAQQPTVFVAHQDGDLIGCLWLNFSKFDEDEVRCRYVPRPTDRTCWDYGVYLHPDHRSGFGFARLWDEANAFLRARGVRWSLSRISTFNVASMTSHRSLGAVTIGYVVFITIGRLQLMFSGLVPRVHLSLGPTRTPILFVDAPEEVVANGPEAVRPQTHD